MDKWNALCVTTTIALVSAHGGLFLANLPIFINANAQFIVVACEESILSNQTFVSKQILFPHKNCEDFIEKAISNPDLIENLPEFVLFDDDDAMYRVANSKLTVDLKVKLLPIKNAGFLDVAGSKIGQIKMFEKLGISHPKSFIKVDLEQIPIQFPFIAKADRFGGGGKFSKVIHTKSELEIFAKEHCNYLIQEIVEGIEYSVEAFYRDGVLIFAQLGEVLDLLHGNGPSSRRNFYSQVPIEIVETLVKIGEELKLNAIVNCTLFQIPNTENFVFFEFDVRLNSWAHVSCNFGFDAKKFFGAKKVTQQVNVGNSKSCSEYIDFGRWISYLRSQQSDENISYLRLISIFIQKKFSNAQILAPQQGFIKYFLLQVSVAFFQNFPLSIRNFIKAAGLNNLIIKVLS